MYYLNAIKYGKRDIVGEIILDIFGFAIGFAIGNLSAIPITQIGCCVFCSMKLLRRLGKNVDCINVSGAKRFYLRAIVTNALIFALATFAVVWFGSRIEECSFFCSVAFFTLIGCGKWGCNETNVGEFADNLQKFVIAGKEEEAFRAFANATMDLNCF